jgi:hypothetical protein
MRFDQTSFSDRRQIQLFTNPLVQGHTQRRVPLPGRMVSWENFVQETCDLRCVPKVLHRYLGSGPRSFVSDYPPYLLLHRSFPLWHVRIEDISWCARGWISETFAIDRIE